MEHADILLFPTCGVHVKRLIALALEEDVQKTIPEIPLDQGFYDEPRVVISLFIDMLMRRIFEGLYVFRGQSHRPGVLQLVNIARVVENDVWKHYQRIRAPAYSPVDITGDILRAIERHTGYVICIAPNTDGG